MQPYSLYKRKLKDGLFWIARLRDKNKKITTLKTDSKARESDDVYGKHKAIEFCENYLREHKQDCNITFGNFTKDFFTNNCMYVKRSIAQGRSISEPVLKYRRSHIEKYLLPAFCNMQVSVINPVDISDFLLSLELSNQTKNHIRQSLSLIMDEAVFKGIIQYNPVKSVKPFSLKSEFRKERDVLSLQEINLLFPQDTNKLYEIWGDQYKATLFFSILTSGMRIGEAAVLQWCHIDFERHILYILQARKDDGQIGKTKTGEQRAVLLPSRTMDMLKAWKEKTPFDSENDFIFYGSDGQGQTPTNRRTANTWFKAGIENCEKLNKIDLNREERGLCIHSLRHSYNTLMRKKIPEDTLRLMMGHSSEKMTDRYDGNQLENKVLSLPKVTVIDDAWQVTE
jgi:integrase